MAQIGCCVTAMGTPECRRPYKRLAGAAPVTLTSQQLDSLTASIMALKHLITCIVAGIDYLVHPKILVVLLAIPPVLSDP